MNISVTSREMILEASRKLIVEQGWAAVNIRSVAAACGVAVGSIYNYFSSKAELTAAAVESVWHEIFHLPGQTLPFQSFSSCVEQLLKNAEQGNRKYPGFLSLHSMSFLGEEKSRGQQLMKQTWQHMEHGLCAVLAKDEAVRAGAFNSRFTPEQFVSLIFTLLVSSLLKEDFSGAAVLELINRSIY